MRSLSGVLTVGVWTLGSRVLGFARDIILAAFLGAGPVAEAFVMALTLPNLFRRFFAEGAFNTAFVPMFSKRLAENDGAGTQRVGKNGAEDFAGDAFAALAGVVVLLTILAMVAMPWFVMALASGFIGDARFDLTVEFGRIAFPYILFISLAALLSGVLNAMGRFSAAAAAPILLNVILISALWLAGIIGWNVGLAASWAVPLAGIAQLVLLWIAVRQAGVRIPLRGPKWTPELTRLAVIAGPAALAGGVVQINLVVGRQVASHYEGAAAWLYYADRLYQLPLGVVGIAIGIVLLPQLARHLQAEDTLAGQETYNRAGELSLALTIPAAVALMAIPMPLVSVLFERGSFDRADALATAMAVAIYGAGLPAFVLQKVVQPLYFAREDTKSPFRFALYGMVANAVLAVGLQFAFGYLAAALGATVAGWIMLALLLNGTRNMGAAARLDARLRKRAGRIAMASAIMGGALILGAWILGEALYTPGLRYVALTLLIAWGGVAYFVAAGWLGAITLAELKSMLRRQR